MKPVTSADLLAAADQFAPLVRSLKTSRAWSKLEVVSLAGKAFNPHDIDLALQARDLAREWVGAEIEGEVK